MVFIAGGIAHGAYGGLGAALFLGVSPLFGALTFSCLLALALAYLTYQNRARVDALIGAIWAFGMAFGVIMIDLKGGYNADVSSFLFGSILSVSDADLVFIGLTCFVLLGVTSFFYKELLAVSFDMEFAKLQGLNTKFFYTLLVVIIAFCVVAAIQAVGLILVVALISIPPFIAERFCSKLSTMMILSAILSTCFALVGLWISYAFNLTSGAAIILVASVAFFLARLKPRRILR
jgi:zinc transport system permease protein